jgi:hypothetical protein
MKTVHILGGGTFSHVHNHLAMAAPAFGTTARQLAAMFSTIPDIAVKLHLTKMADHNSKLVTNEDVATLVDQLVADPDTKAIIFNVALSDYAGSIDGQEPGSHAQRLQSRDGVRLMDMKMTLTPKDKIIGRIRRERKDIFVVGFKATTRFTPHEQYQVGLKLLKSNSLNLVMANDTVTRNNLIITPEEASYARTNDRDAVLRQLVDMVNSRMRLTFTRSTVVEGPAVPWAENQVPDNLFTVVNHLIDRGAYKPFMGKTVGHFAYRSDNGEIITSRRKSNFNDLADNGMIRIVPNGPDAVTAYGGKPSVGGQSQRIIFSDHPELDCIAHAHIPLKEASRNIIPVAQQWPYECGSHECGRNTSQNLREVESGIWAVHLDNHGPNIVFNRNTPAEKVIDFFEKHFDLTDKTGGCFTHEYTAAQTV